MIAGYPFLSIRAWLQLLVLAVVVPVTAVWTWYLAAEAREERDIAYAGVKVLAGNVAANLDTVVREQEEVLGRLAARPLVRALDAKHCDPLLRDYVDLHPEFSTLAVRDRQANIVCSLIPHPPPAKEIREKAWFRESMRNGKFTANNASISSQPGRWVSISAFPVRDHSGNVSGLVFFSSDLLKLNQQLLGTVPRNALVSILDREDRVLLRSVDPESAIGKPNPGGFADKVRGIRNGVFAAPDAAGLMRLYAVTTLPRTGWRVFAGLPEDEALAPARALLTRSIIIGMVVLSSMLALAWWLAHAIAKPIRGLAAVAGDVARGDSTARALVGGPTEVAEVARQFNSMLDAADQARRTLLGTVEKLQTSEMRYALANRATFNAIWDWDLQSGALWWNENLQSRYGYRAEEIEPGIESWSNRIHPEDVGRVMTGIHAAIDSGQQSWSDSYRFRRKDGRYAEVEDRGFISRDAGGNAVRMVGAMQDITERRQAENKISQQLQELQQWQAVMLGREDRVQELKREVNELCRRLSAPVRYPSQEVGADKNSLP